MLQQLQFYQSLRISVLDMRKREKEIARNVNISANTFMLRSFLSATGNQWEKGSVSA